MTPFQLAGIALLGLMTLLGAWRAVSRRSLFDWGWVLLWLSGIVLLVDPDLTRVAAEAVGIQRGVDLVLYLAVIGGVIGFFAVSIRFRRLERQLTTVVRELSMLTPREPGAAPRLEPKSRPGAAPESAGERRINSSSS